MNIILLNGGGTSSSAVYAFLKNNYNLVGVITEGSPSRLSMIKRRIKKLGFFKVLDQLFFMVIITPVLSFTSKKRNRSILNTIHITSIENSFDVNSINNDEVIEYINSKNVDLIVVNGTRIISKKILDKISVPIINTHSGITPNYRGVHGGYWALINNDKNNCGVTVHFVNKGIDTGSVIAQRRIEVTNKDNFTTYPLLQLIEGLKCLKLAIDNISINSTIDRSNEISKLYYHPTASGYLYNRFIKGVK